MVRTHSLLAFFGLLQRVGSLSLSNRSVSTGRRNLFQVAGNALLVGTSAAFVGASPAWAVVPTPKELERLQKGHARVHYLLDHWDDVTKVCGTAIMSDTERKQIIRTEGGGGGDACAKTPLRVQEFMGYKSTEDPLYRADKLMVRAGVLVDPDDFDGYLDVVERYREKADSTALLAYTSSWGKQIRKLMELLKKDFVGRDAYESRLDFQKRRKGGS